MRLKKQAAAVMLAALVVLSTACRPEEVQRFIQSEVGVEISASDAEVIASRLARPAQYDTAHLRRTASDSAWEKVRHCESGGNYSAVSGSGRYRGAYQFSRATWSSVGGSGDPAAASREEQDYRAKVLYDRSGRGQWPHCGRHLPR